MNSLVAPHCRAVECSISRGYVCWDTKSFGARLGRAKLLRISRAHIDDLTPGSDGANQPAWNLIWIDSGNVRRMEIMLDPLFGRLAGGLREIPPGFLDDAPPQAIAIIESLKQFDR